VQWAVGKYYKNLIVNYLRKLLPANPPLSLQHKFDFLKTGSASFFGIFRTFALPKTSFPEETLPSLGS